MDAEISNFLKNYYVDGVVHTHIGMITPCKGKYRLDREAQEKFWNIYCPLVYNNEKNAIVGLGEKPQTYLPVLADIDISLESDSFYLEDLKCLENEKHLYSREQVLNIINIYQSIIYVFFIKHTKNQIMQMIFVRM